MLTEGDVAVVRTPDDFLAMSDEYQEVARRQMLVHAEGEFSGADDYIHVFYALVPNAQEQQVRCESAAEEFNHYKIVGDVAVAEEHAGAVAALTCDGLGGTSW
jgi:ring-1,2-phenylacetyl-CoA epoxidase subunit PaaA